MDEIEYYKYTMPLDNMMLIGNKIFYSRAEWTRTFAWRPHRCHISKRIIWLKMAYRGIVTYLDPGVPMVQYIWHHEHEHLIWILKK